jgi:hypothetical protein
MYTAMSNFDAQIEPEAEYLLQKHPGEHAQHAAWNFCGYVKWDPDWELFIEQVWVYGAHVDTFAAESLYELMKEINGEYGWQ